MKSVSVIIPTFNRAEYLPKAIKSVLSQPDFTGELIIVDDGSTDNTQDIVSQFQYNRSVVYHSTDNLGPAAARNTGVSLAKYSFVAFLDSDDHWHALKLTKQLNMMNKNPEFRISHTYEKWLRRGQHLNQKAIHIPRHGDIFDHCLQLCAVGMSTVIMEKSLFFESGGFDESLPCCEDYDLWLRISMKWPFLLVPEALTVKEGGRDDQISNIYSIGMDRFRIKALVHLLDSGQLNLHKKRLAVSVLQKKCRVYGNGCIKHGKTEEGKRYLAIKDKYSQLVVS